jgi:hypothetical protein
MKNLFLIGSLILSTIFVFAQGSDDVNKATAKKLKEGRKKLVKMAQKSSRIEGDKLLKEKFDVNPGMLPLKEQLDEAYLKEGETDADGYPVWYFSSVRATGNTAYTAKFQATQLALQDIAGQLGSNISGLVENSLANNQITEKEANSLQKTIAASSNLISASLGRTVTFSEFYKKVNSDNMICSVTLGTNAKLAEMSAKKAVRAKLEAETGVVREKLDRILGTSDGDDPNANTNDPK